MKFFNKFSRQYKCYTFFKIIHKNKTKNEKYIIHIEPESLFSAIVTITKFDILPVNFIFAPSMIFR